MEKGSIALVTGASGAIGGAIAAALHARGVTPICVCGKNDAARRALEARGYETLRCDFSDKDELSAVCKALGTRSIDIAVFAAGAAYTGLLEEMTDEDVRRIVEVDLTATMLLTKAVVGHMRRVGAGRIVAVSSIWGEVGASCEVVYSAAKAGLCGFVKALARELGPVGVTVNAVAPGVIDTPMIAAVSEEDRRALAARTALGRLGTAADVAAAVVGLLDMPFVTGQILTVDGGLI